MFVIPISLTPPPHTIILNTAVDTHSQTDADNGKLEWRSIVLLRALIVPWMGDRCVSVIYYTVTYMTRTRVHPDDNVISKYDIVQRVRDSESRVRETMENNMLVLTKKT